jgi:hypothetical protein
VHVVTVAEPAVQAKLLRWMAVHDVYQQCHIPRGAVYLGGRTGDVYPLRPVSLSKAACPVSLSTCSVSLSLDLGSSKPLKGGPPRVSAVHQAVHHIHHVYQRCRIPRGPVPANRAERRVPSATAAAADAPSGPNVGREATASRRAGHLAAAACWSLREGREVAAGRRGYGEAVRSSRCEGGERDQRPM